MAFNSSKAFMSTGIPSENLSIRSFMALAMSDCAAAATVAVMTGITCWALFCIGSIASSRCQDQTTTERSLGSAHTSSIKLPTDVGNPWVIPDRVPRFGELVRPTSRYHFRRRYHGQIGQENTRVWGKGFLEGHFWHSTRQCRVSSPRCQGRC